MRLFVQAGAKVIFNYQRSRELAETLARELGPENCLAVQADLNGRHQAEERLVRSAVERFGRLDILVANHGVWPPQEVPIEKMTDEQWQTTVACNLNSVFELVKHSVAAMKSKQQGGHICRPRRARLGGQRGEAFHCDYAATKGAVISMTKALSTNWPGTAST